MLVLTPASSTQTPTTSPAQQHTALCCAVLYCAVVHADFRCGRIEPLHTMLESLRQQHQQERVMVAMEQHQQKLLQLKAAHTAACAAVTKANEAAVRQAQREHAVAVQQVQTENTRRVSKRCCLRCRSWGFKCSGVLVGRVLQYLKGAMVTCLNLDASLTRLGYASPCEPAIVIIQQVQNN